MRAPLRSGRPRRWFAAALAAAAGALACQPEFPPKSELAGLRVLAIRAEPPEIAPGATSQLTALAVDPFGRPIRYRWRACLRTERGSGAFGGSGDAGMSNARYGTDDPGDCFDVAQATDLGTLPAAELTAPDDTLSAANLQEAYLGGQEASETVLAILRSVAGLNLTVALEVEVDASDDAPADRVVAFKRVNVSLASEPNANPEAPALELVPDGAERGEPLPNDVLPPEGACFVAPVALGEGSHELVFRDALFAPVAYPVIVGTTDPGTPVALVDNDEAPFYAAFSVGGDLGAFTVRGKPGGSPADDPATLGWRFDAAPVEPTELSVVLRDGRGGTAWCRSLVQPAPAP